MVELPQTYRTSHWALSMIIFFIGICVISLIYLSQVGETIMALGFGALLFVGTMTLIECIMNRVVLTHSALEVNVWFKTKTLLPSQISRVVAEKGVPVALELREGGWFKMSLFVTGPHPNTLRAWIKRNGTQNNS